MSQRLSDTVLRRKLAEMDDAIAIKAGEVEDLQLELEALYNKRKAFARRNCPHTKTYTRSIMGRETETRCNLCEIEL